MAIDKRQFFAILDVGFAKDGTTTFVTAHGVQTIGITTNFNLEQVFELGQIQLYENIEQVPEVEVTVEKVLDGYPLIYHLATNGATSGSLVGRSNMTTIMCMSVFADTQTSASGTPIAEVQASGLFVSSLAYSFGSDGNMTETVSLVGNSKIERDVQGGGTSLFAGTFTDNLDKPENLTNGFANGVQRRWNVLYVPYTGGNTGTAASGLDENGMVNAFTTVLPTDIYGISSSGTNAIDSTGNYAVPVQSINVSADLGRQSIFELGRRFPYHRYVSFPVEVRTDIEVVARLMDNIQATEAGGVNGAPAGANLRNQTIRVQLQDGTRVDCGTRNKLQSVAQTGGDAGGGTSNVTYRYSYVGYNTLNVVHPADPSGLTS